MGCMDGYVLLKYCTLHYCPLSQKIWLMQDNDPKHTCGIAQSFYTANNINWWRAPAKSPDFNPVENMWHMN